MWLFTSVSLKGGDQAAAVLLQLQDGHLTRLVPYKRMSGLHVESGFVLRPKKGPSPAADAAAAAWIQMVNCYYKLNRASSHRTSTLHR